MRRLASRLGLTDPAFIESDEQIAAASLPSGISLEQVRERGYIKSSPDRPGFPSKVRISDPVPVPARPSNGWLQLLTPKSHFFLNSTFGNMARQRAAMGRPTLEIHPGDAAARGLADDDEVDVRNSRGLLRAWVKVTDTIHPGVVALPGKWWGRPDATSAVANLLTPSAWAPHGQPAYNDVFVEVSARELAPIAAAGRLTPARET